MMVPSQRNRSANDKLQKRGGNSTTKRRPRAAVRLVVEELEARTVPSITASGTTFAATEGSSFTGVVATFTDSDPSPPVSNFTTSIAWGDGTTLAGTVQATASGFQVTGSHVYAEEGTQGVTVTINDVDGSSATANSTGRVGDAALQVTGTPFTGIEGQELGTDFAGSVGLGTDLQVANLTDANAAGQLTDFTIGGGQIRIDWGDSTFLDYGSFLPPEPGNNAIRIGGGHNYAEPGTYTVTVTITDRGGSQASGTTTATIVDGALTPTPTPVSADEGIAFSGELARITDANPDATLNDFSQGPGSPHPSLVIDWGDGTTSGGTISQPDGFGYYFEVSGNHTYSSAGSFTIKATVTDVDGSTTTATTTAVVEAPTATGKSVTGTEGLGISSGDEIATFTDGNPNASASEFTAIIDWGNGTSSIGLISALGNGIFQVSVPLGINGGTITSPSYAEEGHFTVTTTITDIDGSQVVATATATIADGTLTATGTPVKAVEGVAFSGQVATFTDANPGATIGDDFIWPPPGSGIEAPSIPLVTIDWGDGASGYGWLTQPGGPGTAFVVTGIHTYVKAGSYNVNVKISDNGGSTTSTTTTATVTDPDDIVGRLVENNQIWTGVSTGSSFNSSLWGTLDPNIRWVNVVSGDFTGDGRTDLAARDAATGNWWVAVSSGSSFTVSQWGAWAPKVSWTDVQVGDFNGDGKMDLIGRPAGTGNWWVSLSTGSSFANSLWATWYSGVTWVDVKVGDFNGDGKADITGRVLQSGDWWTGISTGSGFITSFWAHWYPGVTWVDVQVGDFNGDGKADITGRTKESGQWWTAISNGSGFSTSLWATWDPTVTWVDVKVGDFNGDSKADIIGRDLANGQWWVGLSEGFNCPLCGSPVAAANIVSAFFNPPHFETTLWDTWSTGLTWVDVQVGDFNGDGKADITGRALQSGQWWTGVSTGSSFNTTLWSTWWTGVSWADVRSGDFA